MKLKVLLLLIVILAAALRFYKIDQIPHGLYIDEVSIGYNAFTILQTGKDEHGEFLPIFFQAFGEYKLPVYIYLTSFSMALLGKTEFAVRFMSALFGTGTILLFYLFLRTLFSFEPKLFSKQIREFTPYLGAFLLAILPWHIQFSRGGFEATVAVFFFLLGIYLLLRYYQKHTFFLFFSGVTSLLITIYTYSSFRLITPITLLVIFIFIVNKFPEGKKMIFTSIFYILILSLPILVFSFSESGWSRFSVTSAFQGQHLSTLQKIIQYPITYVSNYISSVSFPFIFTSGDGIGRHTIKGIGSLFKWEFFPLLIGIYYSIKHHNTLFAKVLLFLLVVSPLAAALTLPSPHSLRSILLVIPLTAFIAFGAAWILHLKIKLRIPILALFVVIIIFELSQYLHLYYVHYPTVSSLDWGSEYKELIMTSSKYKKTYKKIVINANIGDIQEYIKFYNNDLKYLLVDDSWQKPNDWKNEKVLYITTPDKKKNTNLQKMSHTLITNIYAKNLNHDTFAQFWEL